MHILRVNRCLCDASRLRILNLLLEGPLCVCHLVTVLGMDQPKVSRHLKALKATGLVETERCYNWTICRIASSRSPVLEANLKCLQDLRGEEPIFKADLRRRSKTIARISKCGEEDLPTEIRKLCEATCIRC